MSLPGVKKEEEKTGTGMMYIISMTHLISDSTLSSTIMMFPLSGNRPRSQFGYSCFVLF